MRDGVKHARLKVKRYRVKLQNVAVVWVLLAEGRFVPLAIRKGLETAFSGKYNEEVDII